MSIFLHDAKKIDRKIAIGKCATTQYVVVHNQHSVDFSHKMEYHFAMVNHLIITVLLCLSACAPMPGGKMIAGVDRTADIDNVDIKITRGFWVTQQECHKRLWACGNWNQSILAGLFNFGVIPACSTVFAPDGVVERADIFLAFGDFMLDHEMRHVVGFDDVLY